MNSATLEAERCLRVGLIGAGPRSLSYLKNLPAEYRSRVSIAGVVEPSEASLRSLESLRPDAIEAPRFQNHEDLLAQPLDALIIGAPNSMHATLAQAAFRRKLPTLLEKPVAITLEECRDMWASYEENGRPDVMVGFALRYSSFFLSLQEVVKSGRLGDMLTVDADELVSLSTTALFYKGWRRDASISGGFLVEKCCHDFDLLRALTGSNVSRVFSIAKRTHFRADNPRRHSWNEEAARAKVGGTDSPYDLPTDNPDHQAVMLEWENGVTTCFSVATGQSRNTRRFRISGSQGTVEIDAEKEVMHTEFIQGYMPLPEKQVHEIVTDPSAHHGGDRFITETFWKCAFGEEKRSLAGLRDGIEAVLIALAAQQSAQTGQPVALGPLRQQVFGHDSAA